MNVIPHARGSHQCCRYQSSLCPGTGSVLSASDSIYDGHCYCRTKRTLPIQRRKADVHDETYSLDSGEAVSIENDGYEDYDGIPSDIEWTNDNGEIWETKEYVWRNTTVKEIVTDRESMNGNWEVRVLTSGDYTIGENRKTQINLIWIIAYIIEIAAGIIIYLRKDRSMH